MPAHHISTVSLLLPRKSYSYCCPTPTLTAAQEVLVEIQPHSWALNGIDVEEALRTIAQFGAGGGHVVVTLPHARVKESAVSSVAGHALPELVAPCSRPTLSFDARGQPLKAWKLRPVEAYQGSGMHKARVMSFRQLDEALRESLRGTKRSFHDVRFTRPRGCKPVF